MAKGQPGPGRQQRTLQALEQVKSRLEKTASKGGVSAELQAEPAGNGAATADRD